MKIIADKNIPFLQGRLEKAGIDVVYTDQFGFTPQLVKDADALLIRTRTPINKELLEGSRVKLVATATIGTDQIDFSYTDPAGIIVRNSPGCNAPAVAQYVWSSLLRMGFDPAKHKLGVVGKGNVGGIVTEWGRRLNVEVLVCDPPRKEKGLKDEEYLELPELLKQVDAVTFHTPYIESGPDSTHHLASERELKLLRSGGVMVNASRGPVVDNAALLSEVVSGRLRATVDTWEGEPEVNHDLLHAVDYGTFHIAGYSRQGKERATRMVLEAVEDVFGTDIDTSGLEGPYQSPRELSPEIIVSSYDPAVDTALLRANPEMFDKLRNSYKLREEI